MGAEDEATFGLIPLVSRGWAPRGSKPVVTINQANRYTNVFGARSSRTFVFSFSKRKRQADFVRFLKKLQKRWCRVLLFVDNAKAHHGRKVEEFPNSHRKTFVIEYFPAYTPELNPVEPCWKPGKCRLSNRLIKTLPAAQHHLSKAFSDEKVMPRMFKYLRD